LAHKVSRAEELAERRRAHCVDHAGLEIEENRVALHLSRSAANMVTALARLNVHNLARRSGLEARSTREKKGGRSGET
jgi:hypothetical protein